MDALRRKMGIQPWTPKQHSLSAEYCQSCLYALSGCLVQPSNPAPRPSLELLHTAPLRCGRGEGTPESKQCGTKWGCTLTRNWVCEWTIDCFVSAWEENSRRTLETIFIEFGKDASEWSWKSRFAEVKRPRYSAKLYIWLWCSPELMMYFLVLKLRASISLYIYNCLCSLIFIYHLLYTDQSLKYAWDFHLDKKNIIVSTFWSPNLIHCS